MGRNAVVQKIFLFETAMEIFIIYDLLVYDFCEMALEVRRRVEYFNKVLIVLKRFKNYFKQSLAILN